jgi:hypothetical protein
VRGQGVAALASNAKNLRRFNRSSCIRSLRTSCPTVNPALRSYRGYSPGTCKPEGPCGRARPRPGCGGRCVIGRSIMSFAGSNEQPMRAALSAGEELARPDSPPPRPALSLRSRWYLHRRSCNLSGTHCCPTIKPVIKADYQHSKAPALWINCPRQNSQNVTRVTDSPT